MYETVRTEKQIDDVLNAASEGIEKGSKWRGMSYEQGVEAGIRWLIGDIDDNPMED